MPNIVDRFNINGEEFNIEPVMDDVPTEGSNNTVKSGGVYQSLKRNDVRYDKAFLGAAFGNALGKVWDRSEDAASLVGVSYSLAQDDTVAVSASSPLENQGVEWTDDGVHWTPCIGLHNYSSGYSTRVIYTDNKWLLMVYITNSSNRTTDFYTSEDGKVWTFVATQNVAPYSYITMLTIADVCVHQFNKWWLILLTREDNLPKLFSTTDFTTLTEVNTGMTISSAAGSDLGIACGNGELVFAYLGKSASTTDGDSWFYDSTLGSQRHGLKFSDGYWYWLEVGMNQVYLTFSTSAVVGASNAQISLELAEASISLITSMQLLVCGRTALVRINAGETYSKTTCVDFEGWHGKIKDINDVRYVYSAAYANGIVCVMQDALRINMTAGEIVEPLSLAYTAAGSGSYTGLYSKPIYMKNAGCWTNRAMYSNLSMLSKYSMVSFNMED